MKKVDIEIRPGIWERLPLKFIIQIIKRVDLVVYRKLTVK